MAKRTWVRWIAWPTALCFHVLVLLLWKGNAKTELAHDAVTSEQQPLVGASVQLISLDSEGEQVIHLPSTQAPKAVTGAADLVAADPEQALRDSSLAPGTEAGARAPGPSGKESFSPRSDTAHRSTSPWNTTQRNQTSLSGPKTHRPSSVEAVERSPKREYGDRSRPTTLGRLGATKAVSGLAQPGAAGGLPGTGGEHWHSLDPRWDIAPEATAKVVHGAVALRKQAALRDLGTRASDTNKRGATRAALDSPGKSKRLQASVFELGAPSAGSSTALGAQGSRGKSTAAHTGDGSAAQRSSGSGKVLASTRASRSDPFFYKMYQRIDRELRFPKQLALDLEQGTVVLSFVLDRNGKVTQLALYKASGFREFDKEALRAFRAAAPFGQPTPALFANRDHLRVLAPYEFRNPLIR